jgi:tRNA uridine 5-carboxymethylaminomethyl modification enzyme
LLREDNADMRLTEIGYKLGLATQDSYDRLTAKKQNISDLVEFLERKQVTPTNEVNSELALVGSSLLRNPTSLVQLLRRPEVSMEQIRIIAGTEINKYNRIIDSHVEIQTKYAGYVERQLETVRRFKKVEGVRLPDNFDYSQVAGLSKEVREKLANIRPRSLGQASRIAGITPAAISTLSIYLANKDKNRRIT